MKSSWKHNLTRIGVTLAAMGMFQFASAYTLINNKINWAYLGQTQLLASPYTASGIPSHAGYTTNYPANLPVPSLPADFNARIALMLPEKVDIRTNKQIVLSSDDQTNIKLSAPADVWVTFLNEGAGFLNSVGFFTFDLNKPPLTPADVATEQIIIPNASIPPLKAAGTQGSTVYLGNFPSGTGIGFFVVANGWSATGRTINGIAVPGVKETQSPSWIYYSIKGLNPEPSAGNLNQHTVLLNDQTITGTDGHPYQRLVLGFEDYLRTSGSDHDFNDVTLVIHVSPSVAVSNLIGLPQLVSSTTDPDSDGDGVRDSVDEFPLDANKAFSRWYPGSSTWGTLAYEDMWPQTGDYDLNDLVVRYRSREVLNASRLVSALEMDLRLDARGGTYHSGFAIALPGIAPSNIKSADLIMPDGSTVALSSLTGEAKATFVITNDAYTFLPSSGISTFCEIYYNSYRDCPILPAAQFKLLVDLNTATASFPAAPYDPFIFRTENTGMEVHLPGRQPSGRANTTLFGTGQDATVVGTSRTYMTATGLPWALDIPFEWDYPAEMIDITVPYPDIVPWAVSGGAAKTNWYVQPKDIANTFRNGR